MNPADLDHLACPDCGGALAFHGAPDPGGALGCGLLRCARCEARWPVEDGLPRLYREESVRGNDRLLRHFYDGLPFLHDAAVRYTLPVFQSGTESAMREAYLPRIELGALARPGHGEPARVLEIGVGTGANLPLVRRELPAGLPVEIWGVDLSLGMLSVLRRRLRERPDRDVRLLLADAHALPFPAGLFDRVYHVGAVGSYRDPARALAEMARVAKPGTPIVAVDEQLDTARPVNAFQRAMFRLVTFYERRPHAPVEALPPGAWDVEAAQISRFFYCLRFRVGGRPAVENA